MVRQFSSRKILCFFLGFWFKKAPARLLLVEPISFYSNSIHILNTLVVPCPVPPPVVEPFNTPFHLTISNLRMEELNVNQLLVISYQISSLDIFFGRRDFLLDLSINHSENQTESILPFFWSLMEIHQFDLLNLRNTRNIYLSSLVEVSSRNTLNTFSKIIYFNKKHDNWELSTQKVQAIFFRGAIAFNEWVMRTTSRHLNWKPIFTILNCKFFQFNTPRNYSEFLRIFWAIWSFLGRFSWK